MSLIGDLSGEPQPCEERAQCRKGQAGAYDPPLGCVDCRYALKFPGRFNHWLPIVHGTKHPRDVLSKKSEVAQRERVKQDARNNRDRAKIQIQAAAVRAEKRSERNIIHATKNSGRSNRDGDHVLAGRITLDTKLQTTRLNPEIHVHELEKVRSDARRAGNPIGGLILRNENGHGFVVLAEEDFARLVKELK